jgi:hypothetical protein
MQTEAAGELENMVEPVMQWLSRNTDHADMTAKGNAFIANMPSDRALHAASMLSFANPFFLPAVSDHTAADLRISLETFAEYMMRAKLTIKRSAQPNILLACAPKSASTFLHAALTGALRLPSACLFAATLDWGSAALHGSALREQEPDELSMIRNGLNGRGYVAQHHSRCTPYLARLLGTYHVRPIVTHRNLFDTIVSVDDMMMEWRSKPGTIDHGYFADGLPVDFERLERADRLMLLAHRHTAWLLQFYLSWRYCDRVGLIKPLWISYERDFLGDKTLLAGRIAEFTGTGDVATIAAALEDKSAGKARRLNRGVAGRGADLPDAVRDYILSVVDPYRGDEDLAPLVGE